MKGRVTVVPERAALVTGGSSGIGLAIARELALAGYGVTISGRREDKLRATAEQLRSADLDIRDKAAAADDEDDLKALARFHEEQFGRLDVLVNNAGVGLASPLDGYPTKYLDMQLAVNLRSHIILTRESLSLLKAAGAEHGQAFIFNTSSIAARYGTPLLAIYGATKAAITNWGNGIQKELQNDGIRVTSLSPAFVETAMTEFARQGGIPAETMLRPEDLAKAVAFLISLSPHARVPDIVFERLGDDAF